MKADGMIFKGKAFFQENRLQAWKSTEAKRLYGPDGSLIFFIAEKSVDQIFMRFGLVTNALI